MARVRFLRLFLPGLLGFAACATAGAAPTFAPVTLSGALANDSSVFSYAFVTSAAQTFNFNTTSYAAGGFDPLLTLFSTTTGAPLGFGGGGGSCGIGLTTLCNDANFSVFLGPGSYTLDLTEFPNAALGSLANGFLFAAVYGNDPTATGDDFCAAPGKSFTESDTIPCTQRSANYTVNITAGPTPEPASLLLVLPGVAGAVQLYRRRMS